ncbi:MAG: RsmB/NOP family class I SAM-dependent RNA methyltransferase, partial [Spirochaetes bacterium]
IEKLYKKRTGKFKLVTPDIPFGEPTKYGWHILPDTTGGRGPMYIAKIVRIQ